MKANIKNKCRSCNSKKLVDVLSLGDQYLSDFVTENIKPPKYPLSLIICKECCLLQLKHTVPQSALYTERYGYRSGMNKNMRNELKGIVEKSLEKVKDQKLKKLLAVDIGANDGTLLSYYPINAKKTVYLFRLCNTAITERIIENTPA